LSAIYSGADLVTKVLKRCGEPTNGNSSFTEDVLTYLNHVYKKIVRGGTLFDLDVNESWAWARSRNPIVLTLEPAYTTGGVTLTQGSVAGTFSAAPSSSMQGRFLRVGMQDEVYRITLHNAGDAAFQIDSTYIGPSVTTGSYRAMKLDYEITPQFFYVDAGNNKINFEEFTGTALTATVASGTYSGSSLATAITTALDTAGANNYTTTYNEATTKFTLTSDRSGGGSVFRLLCATGTSVGSMLLPSLGFDDLDYANAASHTGSLPAGGIARLVEPFVNYARRGEYSKIYGIEALRFMQDFPLGEIREGIPTCFTRIAEDPYGKITVRFNYYPKEVERFEVNWVPVPRSIQNNSASIPILPATDVDVLEFGASYFILTDKEDDKAQAYGQLVQAQLKSMMKNNRVEQGKVGKYFGQLIPRPEQTEQYGRGRMRYGYTSED